MRTKEEQIQHWLDHEEVVDCIRRCARGMDRHDAELIMSAYHSDAYDDHGTFRGSATDFVSYVNGSNQSAGVHSKLFSTHQHYVMNQVVELDGNFAHAETYYLMSGLLHSGTTSLVGGRYLDRLERRDGRWGIVVRRVTLEWSADLGAPSPRTDETANIFTPWSWDRHDVSYERPLTIRARG